MANVGKSWWEDGSKDWKCLNLILWFKTLKITGITRQNALSEKIKTFLESLRNMLAKKLWRDLPLPFYTTFSQLQVSRICVVLLPSEIWTSKKNYGFIYPPASAMCCGSDVYSPVKTCVHVSKYLVRVGHSWLSRGIANLTTFRHQTFFRDRAKGFYPTVYEIRPAIRWHSPRIIITTTKLFCSKWLVAYRGTQNLSVNQRS